MTEQTCLDDSGEYHGDATLCDEFLCLGPEQCHGRGVSIPAKSGEKPKSSEKPSKKPENTSDDPKKKSEKPPKGGEKPPVPMTDVCVVDKNEKPKTKRVPVSKLAHWLARGALPFPCCACDPLLGYSNSTLCAECLTETDKYLRVCRDGAPVDLCKKAKKPEGKPKKRKESAPTCVKSPHLDTDGTPGENGLDCMCVSEVPTYAQAGSHDSHDGSADSGAENTSAKSTSGYIIGGAVVGVVVVSAVVGALIMKRRRSRMRTAGATRLPTEEGAPFANMPESDSDSNDAFQEGTDDDDFEGGIVMGQA